MKFLLGVATAFVFVGISISLFVVSGGYNVAAVDEHGRLTHWLLQKTKERSIAVHAKSVHPPGAFTPDQVRQGFLEFNDMCVTCHGAPGKESEIANGLNPSPPDLSKAAGRWSNAELFWILKNGIKMTGMPSFAASHSDDTLWSIVSFLRELPRYTITDYEAMVQRYAKETKGSESHGH